MKILLIGEYYSTNLGDPLLCRVVENAIKEEYPSADVISMDLSGKTSYSGYYAPSTYSSRQRWYFRLKNRLPLLCRMFPLLRAYETDPGRHMRVISLLGELLSEHSFDIAVFAGGSLFMDYFAGVIYDVISTLSKKKVPIMFHACGMSRLSPDARRIFRRAIRFPSVKWISLRDSYDQFLKRFSPKCPVKETYDTALLCSTYYPLRTDKQYDYGIGVISLEEYAACQKELVKWAHCSGKPWCLFTNGSPADYVFAKKLLEEMDFSADHLVMRPKKPQELIETITCCRQIISFRMHSQIIAASFGVPSFGIAWDSKVVEFQKKLGFPENCSAPTMSAPFDNIFSGAQGRLDKLQAVALKQGNVSKQCLIEGISYVLKGVKGNV